MWVRERQWHFVRILGLENRFVPDTEFFCHSGEVWKGDFQPEKSYRVLKEMISAAAVAVMITVHHVKQITNSALLPACPFTHTHDWMEWWFFSTFLLKLSITSICSSLGTQCVAFPVLPEVVWKWGQPIIKIKSHLVYSIASGCVRRSSGLEETGVGKGIELECHCAPSTLSHKWSPHRGPEKECCEDCEKNKFRNWA